MTNYVPRKAAGGQLQPHGPYCPLILIRFWTEQKTLQLCNVFLTDEIFRCRVDHTAAVLSRRALLLDTDDGRAGRSCAPAGTEAGKAVLVRVDK